MQNKLQELTDRLYNEGLSKGRTEAESILKQAKEEAEKIISQAESQAAVIKERAEKNAADLRDKAESDIRTATKQSLQATKKDIEHTLERAMTSGKTTSVLSDTDFIKEIIRTVAQKFDSQQSTDIALLLPESLRTELEPWVADELSKTIGNGISVAFSKKISGGMTIGPKDGSYFVSLTDETFTELICQYLRPVTRKIIFGE